MNNKIIEQYLNGESTVLIGEKLNKDPSVIRKFLIKNGIKLRNNKENSLKYSFNDSYFDEINTEEKAYWLGFMYADGYVTGDCFGISLKSDDIFHLEKFKECLSSTHPIHIYRNNSDWSKNEYCRLLIRNSKCVNSLISHGVFRNKTLILKPPNLIDDNLIKHFIRGYFDGDGGIIKNGNSFRATFMGTPDMILWIDNFLMINTEITKIIHKKRHKEDFVISTDFYGKNCYNVICFLYNDSKIYLERKYQRYLTATKYFSRLYQK